MQMKNSVIGVDMGTTSIKTVAFSSTGAEISRTSAHLHTFHGPEGAVEQDPLAVYETVSRCLMETVTHVVSEGYRISQVGFSAAMHSLLCVDQNNQPLTNAMIWMDTRAHKEASDFVQSRPGKAAYVRTGTPIHPMTPLAKLMWMQNHQSHLLKETYKFVSLKEWVWHEWFKEWQIDESMAGATGLYNLETRSWDIELLEMLGLRTDQLSDIVPTTHIRNHVQNEQLLSAGLEEDTLFNIGASDGVLANLGSGATETGTMALTMGTSLAVRLGSQEIYTDEQTQPFCYVLDPFHYVIGGPSNSGGVVLNWLHSQIDREDWLDDTERDRNLQAWIDTAAAVDIQDLYCIPYLAGERAPLWDAEAKAAFVGLQLQHSKAHLMRAAIEGILLNAYWIAQPLIKRFGSPERLIVSGKLLEKSWVRQFTSDLFGTQVEYHGSMDASVLGAVRLCKLAAQLTTEPHKAIAWESLDNSQADFAVSTPDVNRHQQYQEKLKSFQRLVHRINDAQFAD